MKSKLIHRDEPARVLIDGDNPWLGHMVGPGRVFEAAVQIEHNGKWVETLTLRIEGDGKNAKWSKSIKMTGGVGPAPDPVLDVKSTVDEGRLVEHNFDVEIVSEKDFVPVPGSLLDDGE